MALTQPDLLRTLARAYAMTEGKQSYAPLTLAVSLFTMFMCLCFFRYTVENDSSYFWVGQPLPSFIFTYTLWIFSVTLFVISATLIFLSTRSIKRQLDSYVKSAGAGTTEPAHISSSSSTNSFVLFLKDLFEEKTDPAERPVTRFLMAVFRYLRAMCMGGALVAGAFLAYLPQNDSDYIKPVSHPVPIPANVPQLSVFENILSAAAGFLFFAVVLLICIGALRLLDRAYVEIRRAILGFINT